MLFYESRIQKKGVFGLNPDAILEKVKEVIVDQLGVEEESIKTDTS